MKAAVIGLGIIGSQWATHLHSDGVLAACWNRTPKTKIPLFESDLNKIPQKANVIHICLADPPAVEAVLMKIKEQLGCDHLVVQSSTIDPSSAAKFRSLVEARSAKYVEAPFTGSLPAAEKRELIFYLGGDENSIQIAKPYLAKLSKKTFQIGSEKQAATLKLAMNLQIASVMQALSEALTISRSAGVSDAVFFEAFKMNASYSGVAALKENKLRLNDFSPQFSVKHMAKDLRLLKNACQGRKTNFLDVLQEVFKSAERAGLGDEDFSALVKLCT